MSLRTSYRNLSRENNHAGAFKTRALFERNTQPFAARDPDLDRRTPKAQHARDEGGGDDSRSARERLAFYTSLIGSDQHIVFVQFDEIDVGPRPPENLMETQRPAEFRDVDLFDVGDEDHSVGDPDINEVRLDGAPFRFEVEAQLIARLEHPILCRCTIIGATRKVHSW